MTDIAQRKTPITSVPERTGVIEWSSLPRRIVTIYTPLVGFLIVLLFPFYWMTITTFKSNEELYNFREYNPFWVHSPTLANVNKLLFETDYPRWLMTTMTVAVVATVISLFAAVLAAYAIQRLRFKGGQYVGLGIYLAYLVPPSILFIPLATMVFRFGLYDSPMALILTYPTFLIPFCTWLLMGFFMSIPIELEESAFVDGCTRLGVLFRIVLPISLPALAVVAFFSFTLSWNEYLYAVVFNSDPHVLTIPTGLSNFVVEDVFFWGPIMASTALTVIPPLLVYFFFQRWLITGLTMGAVKA